MIFNTESDFNHLMITDPKFPRSRWYVVAGGPHIPDTPLTRLKFPYDLASYDPDSPPVIPWVEGTTPLNWVPFIKALFVAGDRWVREGVEPPNGVTLRVNPKGDIVRDVMGNAVGGIRHPSLQAVEATFIASVIRGGGWSAFGGYRNPRRLPQPRAQSADKEFDSYVATFKKAAEALHEAGFLLEMHKDMLIEMAQRRRYSTFTLNYLDGLLDQDA